MMGRMHAYEVQPLVLAGALMVLASLVGWGLLLAAAARERRYGGARRVTGRVVELVRDPGTEYAQMGRIDAGRLVPMLPRVEWVDEVGTRHTFISRIATTPPPAVGSDIPVRHLPGRPETAQVGTTAARALWFVVGGVLGPVMTVVGLVLVLIGG